jgi:bisanhydrobacterioruberin hydratase
MLKQLDFSFKKDILFLVVVYAAGIIGIHFNDSFLKLSFVSLIIPFVLFLIRLQPSLKNIFLLVVVFIVTFLAEWIGVNYGWIFGEYIYGDSLGFKIGGVPLMIGVNWVLLSIVSRQALFGFLTNKYLVALISPIVMLIIDLILEPIAPELRFWNWSNINVPISNYRDWFIVALISQFVLLNFKKNDKMIFWSIMYLIILTLFFLSFYLK